MAYAQKTHSVFNPVFDIDRIHYYSIIRSMQKLYYDKNRKCHHLFIYLIVSIHQCTRIIIYGILVCGRIAQTYANMTLPALSENSTHIMRSRRQWCATVTITIVVIAIRVVRSNHFKVSEFEHEMAVLQLISYVCFVNYFYFYFSFTDGISVEDSPGTHCQHAQLRPIHGQHGAGDFEEENRQPGKHRFGLPDIKGRGTVNVRQIGHFLRRQLWWCVRSRQSERYTLQCISRQIKSW